MSDKEPGFAAAIEVHSQCFCLHLMRAARAVGRRYDDALRPAEINGWQFSLLMQLNRPASPSIGALAGDLVMDRTTLTANLKPLERNGLVSIRADENDARLRVVSLTRKGKGVLAKSLPLWRQVQSETSARFNPVETERMLQGLRAFE